jgi:hypothetical protein
MTEDAKFWLLLLVTFLGGGIVVAIGNWIRERFTRPRVVIEYGSGHPFVDTAKFAGGGEEDFIRVRVCNKGRRTAERCKCYVRNIKLKKGGKVTALPSENLMLSSWVPREEGVTIKNIPPHAEFFADVAYACEDKGKYTVVPVFNIQNSRVAWAAVKEPWAVEKKLLTTLSLPPRHQLHVVAEGEELTAQMMGTDAGLHADQARRHVCEPSRDLSS